MALLFPSLVLRNCCECMMMTGLAVFITGNRGSKYLCRSGSCDQLPACLKKCTVRVGELVRFFFFFSTCSSKVEG